MRNDPKPRSGSEASSDPPSDAGRLSADPPAGADDQLHTTRQLLIYTLRYSRIFPAETTNDWVDGLCSLDVGAPEAGRAILSELREGYEWAKRQYRPDASMATAGATAGLGAGVFFEREVGEIDIHLDTLEVLLNQAEAWLGAPGSAPGGADGA